MGAPFKSVTIAYRDGDGKTCRKGDPGAQPVRIISKRWYGRFKDGSGKFRTVALATDKAASRAMLAKLESEGALVRSGLADPKAPKYRDHEQAGLSPHLLDFEQTLRNKGNTRKHASVTRNRAARVIELTGALRISDISLSAVQGAIAGLGTAEGLGLETLSHYVRAVKAFSRWLWRDGRAREHVLAALGTFNPKTDRRRVRRALTPEEAARLIRAAEKGGDVQGLDGPTRAVVYRLALGSGLRAAESAALNADSFTLDAAVRVVIVAAGYSKRRRKDEQPLPAELVKVLRPFLKGKPQDEPLFRLTGRTAEMLRVDLAAAKIAYSTAAGLVDFHGLRHPYISQVVESGASPRLAQELARHSTPVLTIGRYAHTKLHSVRAALDALPSLDPTKPARARKGRKTT
jgi:integrase